MQSWYRTPTWHYALWPLSQLYRFAITKRRQYYQAKSSRVTQVPVPVVVVGNLTVGGTGKTPLIIALCQFLRDKGYRPGVISRGYTGKADTYPMRVFPDSKVLQSGDEPLLIAQRSGCPVVVDPNRVRAAKHLLDTTDCNIILSDDGMQHYALGRDIEIAVVDGKRRFGNNMLLPAGPMREPITRLAEVDYIVANGHAEIGEHLMLIEQHDVYNLINPEIKMPLVKMPQPFHMVVAIGNPERLFRSLRQKHVQFIPQAFDDHHIYTPTDLDFDDDAPILMTEKDAVKCQRFARDNYWVLPITATLQPAFKQAFLEQLAGLS